MLISRTHYLAAYELLLGELPVTQERIEAEYKDFNVLNDGL